jgi:F0F1-type ATP synthase membrane subunit c/vacuolar-type H+-ATPase subunit K
MRIWPRPDGSCPSCNGLIAQADIAPRPAKTSAAIIKRAAKETGRRKTAARKGRSAPPSPPSEREMEPVYLDYLQTARDVRRGSLRVFYPYLAVGIIIAVACIALSFATWQEQLVVFTKELQPVPFTWVLIWGGIVSCLGCIVLGAVQGDRWGSAQAREIAKDRSGFPEFYKAFLRRYWPKEGMISGTAFAKFLLFLGTN